MRALLILLVPLLLAPSPPRERNHFGPDRSVDLLHLHLDLDLDVAAGTVSGSATWRAQALRPNTVDLRFDQIGLQIEAVSVGDAPCTFTLGDEELVVHLPQARPVGEPFELHITYRAAPTHGLHRRAAGRGTYDTHDELWTQGEMRDNRHWFPGFEHPWERFTYSAELSAEDRFTVVTGGKLLGKEPAARRGWTTWRYDLGAQTLVNYLVVIAAAEYERHDQQWRHVPLYVFTPPGTGREAALRGTARTGEMMDFLEEITGVPYPHASYSQVFVQRFLYTGMENTSATLLDSRLLLPEGAATEDRRGEGVVIHELAHQWFGDLLTCRDWTDMWLNEGVTTFVEDLWGRRTEGEDWWARRVRERAAEVRRRDHREPLPLATRFPNDSPHDAANTYRKGGLTMEMLRTLLGDEAFFAGLRGYVGAHAGRDVTSDDLRRAMEEASGMYLQWFFDQWVYGEGHPVVELSQRVDGGVLTVTAKQDRSFHLPLDLEIATTAGVSVERMWLDSASASLSLPLDGELRYLAVDPRGGLLIELERSQPHEAWIAQLGSAHAGARAEALDALAELTAPADSGALEALVADAGLAGALRSGAARALVRWERPAPVIGALGDAPARLRAELAEALGLGTASDAVIETLDRLLDHDPDPDVRGAALEALGKLQQAGTLTRARRALRETEEWGHAVRSAAVAILHHHGVQSDLRALRAARSPAAAPRLRNPAWWASVAIAERIDSSPARAALAREAEAMLRDTEYGARSTAIGVLKKLGDDRSAGELRALLARENARHLRSAAEAAIEAISER